MSTINLKLYKILKTDLHLSDDKAQDFVDALREEVKDENKVKHIEFKSELKEDFSSLRSELKSEIKDSKTDMIKWFFSFFVTLVIMILGLFATILLK